jgi:hypothetical protein
MSQSPGAATIRCRICGRTPGRDDSNDRGAPASNGNEEVLEMKQNCWDFKKCGRQPGGAKVADLGVCPATVYTGLDGTHSGKNGGRACWVVAGSLCGGKIQGTYAMKLHNCWRCDFMNAVKAEEEPEQFGFSHTRLGMDRAKEKKQKHQTAEASSRELAKR